MASPPERLRVKRKRDDDPVDALYLQASKSHGKRRATGFLSSQYIFRRLHEDQPTIPQSNPQVPRIISTQPGEEIGFFERQHSQHSTKATDSVQEQRAKAQTVPRHFHLSRITGLASSTPVNRKRKHEKADQNVAVFVEKRSGATRRSDALGVGNNTGNFASQHKDVELEEPPRKRPSANARVHKQSAPSEHRSLFANTGEKGGDADDQKEKQLQNAMQEFAMEHVKNERGAKPKPHYLNDGPANGDDVDMADDDEYVYDTYVRYPVVQVSSSMDTIAAEVGNIGYIMLEEGDEEWWEKYADEMDSDDDWNSEQDDENAENFYGADYPEEELASEDEHGTNPYRYRHGVSDDEEFGSSDSDDWTANGYDDHYPWKANPWKTKEPLKVDDVEDEAYK